MKNRFYALVCCVLLLNACQPKPTVLNDGVYLVEQAGYDSTNFKEGSKTFLLSFNKEFVTDPFDYTKVLVNTSEFVPMELEQAPQAVQQMEAKKKLQLTLSPEAATRLERFTAKHLMHQVVLVIGGEALTMHKIRDTIRGGHLEITRCSDNACEKLEVHLKDNVKRN